MSRHFTAVCMFAVVLLIPQAHAQCPAGSNPLQALAGVWSFQSEGFNFPPTQFLAAAGRFTASISSTTGLGVLSVTQTASTDGGPVRLTTDSGKFQVNADCTGGNLNFNTPGRPDQYDFFFVNANRIEFIGTNNADIVCGAATRVSTAQAAPVCPANALSSLVGTWTFAFDGFHFPPTLFLAAAGRFTASIGVDRNGNPLGVLDITQSSSIDGNIARLESDIGRFALNDTCSGGTLTFNTSSRAIQFDFFFTDANTIRLVASNNADIVEGSATRVQ